MLAGILTNDIIELSESVKQKEKSKDINDSGSEGDNGGEQEDDEEEVKKESNERSKKGRWVSCILFYSFIFFSMSDLLFLFAIILRFLMLCLKEWKLLMLVLTYDMDT